MKGAIGVIACDGPGCPVKFAQAEMQPAKGESAKLADAAESDALQNGWTVELRTRAYHYCPVHTSQRRNDKKAREQAAQNPRPEH